MSPSTQERALGAFRGLAVGDALGTTLEFQDRDSQPCTPRCSGAASSTSRSARETDDTSMALALADSFIVHPTLDATDLMQRFVAWAERGDHSCTSTCFDIGGHHAAGLATLHSD